MAKSRVRDLLMAFDDQRPDRRVSAGTVLLVHGHPFDRSMWQPQTAPLARAGWRVIAPDLRGYGETSVTSGTVTLEVFADDLAALLDMLEVETAAPLIESSRADVSQVINSAQIQNLPINGRRVDSFVLLSPGVVPDGTFGLLSFRGIAVGNSFLTDGNDTTNQYFNENAGRTRIATQLSQDAVQEFQVLIDNYSAEFGRALGGVVNTVTRSGSNDIHGTAYWFFRNQDFNARDPFAMTNPPERRHQAGASLGGRLVRDKLFYFFNGETTRRDKPQVAAEVRRMIEAQPHEGVEAAIYAMMRRPDSTPDLGGIRCPTRVIVGEEDTITPPADAEAMHRAIAGSRFQRLAGAGHLSNLEAPAEFSTTINGWVESLPSSLY